MRLLGALVTVGKSCNVRMLELFLVDWDVEDDGVSFEGTYGRLCFYLAGKDCWQKGSCVGHSVRQWSIGSPLLGAGC